MIDVDQKDLFSLDRLYSFLDSTPTEATFDLVSGWRPVNTLAYQKVILSHIKRKSMIECKASF